MKALVYFKEFFHLRYSEMKNILDVVKSIYSFDNIEIVLDVEFTEDTLADDLVELLPKHNMNSEYKWILRQKALSIQSIIQSMIDSWNEDYIDDSE